LLFSEWMDLLLPLLLLLLLGDEEELDEDLESCLLRLNLDADPFGISMS
jgi:hypothetical protein